MRKFVKIISLVIVVAMVATLAVAFTGCNDKPSGEKEKLYVGLECAYAPFNFTQSDDSNGAVPIYNTNYKRATGYANGYDVMIAKKIAESLGRELVVVKMEWDPLIPAVMAGTIDMIIAGMSPTAERKESIDFSDAYYDSQLVVVVRKDGAYKDAQSLADLSGAKITAQSGTFHLDALNAQGPAKGIVNPYQQGMEDFPAMINALNTRVIDGYVAEEPGAVENCASNSDFTYIHLTNNGTGFAASAEDTAIAVGLKKGSALTAKVNAALAAINQETRLQMMVQATNYSTGTNVVE